MLAINDVSKQAVADARAHLHASLDRPTPWTIKRFRVLQYARKTHLQGYVGFDDLYGQGGAGGRKTTDPGYYLKPLLAGSARPAKGLELLMRARGLIDSGEFIVPSTAQKLNQYGNVSAGVIQKISANLRVTFDKYSRTPSGGARGGKKKAEYYFTRRGVRGQTLTAIWHRFPGGHAFPAFIVVSGAPRYKKQINLKNIVDTSVRKHFAAAFANRYAQAARTAR